LAAEESHFNSKEQNDGWRLSCQVPVKYDLKIRVPEEVFGVKESPLISIETSPVATNFDLAAMITKTSNNTIPQNKPTPKIKPIFIIKEIFLQMT
jgi:Na+-transporting NADH:ubiquinone oxidoreductase subunit NqrF